MANPRKNLKRVREDGGDARMDRATDSRETNQDRELTDEERVDMLRRTLFQSSLPDLPRIPGFHVFWATTTNPRDPVHGRLRLGYSIIKTSDVPGWEELSIKTGEYAGAIGINEMIGMKIPLHLYESFMREVHHDEPLRQEQAIFESHIAANEVAMQSARRGGQVKAPVIEAGSEGLGQAREAPVFSQDEQDG
jgi:hypothetical protein